MSFGSTHAAWKEVGYASIGGKTAKLEINVLIMKRFATRASLSTLSETKKLIS